MTAFEIWNALENYFTARLKSRIRSLKVQLKAIKKHGSTVSEYISKMNKIPMKTIQETHTEAKVAEGVEAEALAEADHSGKGTELNVSFVEEWLILSSNVTIDSTKVTKIHNFNILISLKKERKEEKKKNSNSSTREKEEVINNCISSSNSTSSFNNNGQGSTPAPQGSASASQGSAPAPAPAPVETFTAPSATVSQRGMRRGCGRGLRSENARSAIPIVAVFQPTPPLPIPAPTSFTAPPLSALAPTSFTAPLLPQPAPPLPLPALTSVIAALHHYLHQHQQVS
ncbi:mucin-7-like [Arachis ipaensis]|uniref:mucin-7-like n=1 Tax=Arachis ipaensis TaxID=130454 RepID=UPI0007AF211A|nr:mucin-7-like [Arachis ipaensis]XP_025669782.1 mucin-7-like [Arachis hypogaea]